MTLPKPPGSWKRVLRGSEHCVVIGGKPDLERILPVLESRGIEIEEFKLRKRLTV